MQLAFVRHSVVPTSSTSPINTHPAVATTISFMSFLSLTEHCREPHAPLGEGICRRYLGLSLQRTLDERSLEFRRNTLGILNEGVKVIGRRRIRHHVRNKEQCGRVLRHSRLCRVEQYLLDRGQHG